MLDIVAVIATMTGLKELISIFSPNKEINMWDFMAQEHKVFAEETVAGLPSNSHSFI